MTTLTTTRVKLTNSVLKGLSEQIRRVNDTELPGFHLRISERGKMTYYLFYRLHGKQVNFKLGSHPQITPAQAREMAKQKAGEVANGIDVQQARKAQRLQTERDKLTRLEAFIEQRYRPYQETRNPKTATKLIQQFYSGFPELLPLQLSDITAARIENWRNAKKKGGMKDATINSYVATLKAALNRAVDWDLIDHHDLQKVKPLKSDNTRVRYLEDDEEQRLREALRARDQRLKNERDSANKFRQQRGYPLKPPLYDYPYADHLEPIVLLAMNTGLRKSELLSLTWADVDIKRKHLTILPSNAKSGKTRHVPLNSHALNVFKGWAKHHAHQHYVFERAPGDKLQDVKKSWNKVLEEAQIENFRFHDLRHHFASQLAMRGVDLNTIRELLGHHSMEMTLRYAHLRPEKKTAAVDLL
ncbi:tyrosine-type recombinase/integrase [Pseudidiomarina homiensis]|uniref:Integrase n=2 Tax=Pseudidiomarina homiensis TaxID=364198 RepID=A0A432XUF9_9GAMM|nr:tyrosine-type recombinase/integrase [Pseudidiomarina homiensis]RUO52367.1 integrase [Pseudidiomarina homiensis]